MTVTRSFDADDATVAGSGDLLGRPLATDRACASRCPSGGRRFFVTVDIAETARPAKDIRLSLPVGNGYAVEMYSGNDGPVDAPLENPNTLGISATDRIILTAEWFATGVALPGANDAACCSSC